MSEFRKNKFEFPLHMLLTPGSVGGVGSLVMEAGPQKKCARRNAKPSSILLKSVL